MARIYRVIRRNWSSNHRHHGGVRAVARCFLGSLVLRAGLASRRAEPAGVEILTFSVVPWMTTLWSRLLWHALANRDTEIVVGDCSGGLGPAQRSLMADDGLRVLPCLNEHHGDKIDLFLAELCRAPYVMIADDDVFWLSGEPLAWALAELDADPRVAAVSLLPRRDVSSVLRRNGITEPMGSHCLVIRRELWRNEGLSFAVAPPPAGAEDWFYDTGDLANRELLRRGYRVVTAAPGLGRHLIAFDGVSSWILKLQGHSPDRLSAVVADIPVRQQKALQAIHFARALAALLAELGLTAPPPEIVPAARLAAAEHVLEAHVAPALRASVRHAVDNQLGRLRERLLTLRS